jgi:hypothetical protein
MKKLRKRYNMFPTTMKINGKTVKVCLLASGSVWVAEGALQEAGIDKIQLAKGIVSVHPSPMCGYAGFIIKRK